MFQSISKKHMKIKAFLMLLIMSAFILVPSLRVCLADFAPAEAKLKVEVEFTGDEQPEEVFEVSVTPAEGAPEPDEGSEQSVSLSYHKPSGKLVYSFLFNEETTYSYTVTQKSGNTEGVTYDESSYTITFEAYAMDMALHYVMRVSKDGEPDTKPSSIKFSNTYETFGPALGDPPIKIVKKLTGDPPPEDVPFVFIMKPLTKGAPLPGGATGDHVEVTIVGEGSVEIGIIEFSEEGVYEYEVKERDDNIEGYTYDDATFLIRYTVTKGDKGQLHCEREMIKTGVEEPQEECVYTNKYTLPEEEESSEIEESSEPSSSDPITPEPVVKTGDDTSLLLYIVLISAALTVMTAIVLPKRKNVK